MIKYYVIMLNNLKCAFELNTKRHRWMVYFGNEIRKADTEPDMEFSQSRGNAVLQFLRTLEKRLTPSPV